MILVTFHLYIVEGVLTMRKHIKQNLFDIIKTMYEAHGVVKGNIESGDFDNAVALLSDCQNTAVDLGSLIEETEGENTRTVALLEEYCDELYNSAVSISENENVNSYKLCKNIDKKLRAVENSVRSDIKVRLEIVFMPYKASMWDSLESVWKAADEDPECDAYVVPIPYYDRTPQGTFGEYHYEGNEFPEYVPIVHYDAYDLEKRRPDVIYIHNPYDNNNFVTSVDPRFYSFMLKKYTDKLVYIPYYVLWEENEKDEERVGHISHHCTVPAIINADYSIMQSSNMKNIFMNVVLKQFGEEYRDLFEHRLLAYGSPKIDCTREEYLNNQKISKEWLDFISERKVVFYNTSVGAILYWNDVYLKKLKMVFEYFKNNKEKVILWRPHPLFESTFKSMRTQYYEEYCKLKDYFINNKIGIIDTNPSMYPAIAVSDEYYGDPSSVIWIYLHTKKKLYRHGFEEIEGIKIAKPIEEDFLKESEKLPDVEEFNDGFKTNGERIYYNLKNIIVKG